RPDVQHAPGGALVPPARVTPLLRPLRRALGAVGVRGRAGNHGGGAVRRAVRGSARLPAGRQLPDPLHPRALGLDEPGDVRADGLLRRDRAHLADQAVRDPGHGLRADRRRLHRHHPGHRQHLGQADVGYLVGLGPAPDLAAGAAVPLLRRDRAVRGDRGPPRRRAPGFAAGKRRRGDAAERPLLGGGVELAAPGPDEPRVRRVVEGPEHDAAAAGDGGRHEVLGDRLAAGPRPRRQPRPRGRQGLGQAPGRRGCGMTYLAYVVAAYAVFAAVLLWDFVAPRIRIAQVLRASRLLARREPAIGQALEQELERGARPDAADGGSCWPCWPPRRSRRPWGRARSSAMSPTCTRPTRCFRAPRARRCPRAMRASASAAWWRPGRSGARTVRWWRASASPTATRSWKWSTTGCCPTCSARARRWSPPGACARACSWPRTCWPSTTRPTYPR